MFFVLAQESIFGFGNVNSELSKVLDKKSQLSNVKLEDIKNIIKDMLLDHRYKQNLRLYNNEIEKLS